MFTTKSKKICSALLDYTMRTNLLNWCNLISINSKNVVFYAFLVVNLFPKCKLAPAKLFTVLQSAREAIKEERGFLINGINVAGFS